MTQINQLSSTDDLSGSDLVPVWSQTNGDTRKVSLTNLAKQAQTLNSTSLTEVTQFETPTTGAVVPINANGVNTLLIISGASTLASLTITLPAAAGAVDGQDVAITSAITVTTVTYNANGATAVTGGQTSLSTTTPLRLRYYKASNTWYRIV